MMWLVPIFCVVTAIIFLSIIFAIAKNKNRYDLIDVAWGLTFIAIAGVSYLTQLDIRLFSVQSLVTLLVIIWGMRLSLHIYSRWSKADKEDGRYTDMRQQYAKLPGGIAINMYIRVFIIQALLAVLVSTSVIVVNNSEPVVIGVFAAIGLGIWLIGFIFESVGDKQLQSHLANPNNKGKLMTSGLWKYTRHPNYFGEATQWWGIWIIALSVPFGYIGILGPIVITTLLCFISGIPLTEKHFEGRPGWSQYKKRTSIFLPLPPKKG
jgi:steroid 5-alpha reductase family enzyme